MFDLHNSLSTWVCALNRGLDNQFGRLWGQPNSDQPCALQRDYEAGYIPLEVASEAVSDHQSMRLKPGLSALWEKIMATHATPSVFHSGEQEIQSRLGIRDKMERFGSRVIREYMPDQHRDFYQQLPFVAVAHLDQDGWPWASLWVGEQAGFIQSPDDRSLVVDAVPLQGDPLQKNLVQGQRLGFLGIELDSRRRNRISGSVGEVKEGQVSIRVDQAFGNCPQYIQTHNLTYLPQDQRAKPTHRQISGLDEKARKLISQSDTFFVASHYDDGSDAVTNGADASHRGGQAGFVRVGPDDVLTIPDYAGNNHFNTLGNIHKSGKAGLLFVDFASGSLLSLTGHAKIPMGFRGNQTFQWCPAPLAVQTRKRGLVNQRAAFSLVIW